jgi:hypothetical protein
MLQEALDEYTTDEAESIEAYNKVVAETEA